MRKEDSFAFETAMMVYGLENPISTGMTTCVFEYKKGVQAVTVDKIKIDFMKKASLPGFNIEMDLEDSFLYSMDKLYSLSKEEESIILEKVSLFKKSVNLNSLSFSKDSEEYKMILDLFGIELADGLSFVYSKNKSNKIYLDLHEEQFMKDSNGKIFCLDAVMDKQIYKEIQATN